MVIAGLTWAALATARRVKIDVRQQVDRVEYHEVGGAEQVRTLGGLSSPSVTKRITTFLKPARDHVRVETTPQAGIPLHHGRVRRADPLSVIGGRLVALDDE